jgi:hypothetical protein
MVAVMSTVVMLGAAHQGVVKTDSAREHRSWQVVGTSGKCARGT